VPYDDDVPYASYATPGFGGRSPVNWIGPAPQRRQDKDMPCRRPVVAVLDTGVGSHQWWDGTDIVTRGLQVNGADLGFTDPSTDPETRGAVLNPLTGLLDSDAGHGTFIAGLIHQLCPDANILSVRVMPSDGAVSEDVLLDTLTALAARQHAAQEGGHDADLIDVVSLSLGYYHELPSDPIYDSKLFGPISQLAQMGVAVVASAGNEATYRPMYPAAFTPHAGGLVSSFDASCTPLISVGALNPNGTVAMFSNAGEWVTCNRPGADLVSTFPRTFQGAEQSDYSVGVDGWTRATIDPDDFSSGFGTWSGTSFSAPYLAGELAQALLDGCAATMSKTDPATGVRRGWAAVTACTGIECP
jgi:subtilisin family serine protease